MAIEAAFLDLATAFDAMCDALQGLALTAIEDRPPHDEVLLVERFGNLVDDLRGWAAEGRASAAQARNAVEHPIDKHHAYGALVAANKRFLQLEYRFFNEMIAHETISELSQFGLERGGEWRGWSGSVVIALTRCRDPVRAVDEAFLGAWQDLAEQLRSGSFSVWNTNIGQQITAPPERSIGQAPKRRTLEGTG